MTYSSRAFVAFKSAHQRPVNPSHCTIRADVGASIKVGQTKRTGAAPRNSRVYPCVLHTPRIPFPSAKHLPVDNAADQAQNFILQKARVVRTQEGQHNCAIGHLDIKCLIKHSESDAWVNTNGLS